MGQQEDGQIRGEAEELSRTDPSLRQLMIDYCSSPEFRLLRSLRSHTTTTRSTPSPIDTPPEQIPSKLDPATGSAAIARAVTDLLHRREERGLERPWSIAELGLSTDEFLHLSTWAAGLDVRTVRLWLGNSWTFETLPSGARYSRQACLGLLLLTFAAEAARREATEGRLWPHVRRDNSGTRRFGSGVDYELFDYSGHPTDAFKQAIESAAQTFGLRNVLQDLDSQRYYLTVFLQFGFTIRDARLRLGQWLTGATAQTATGHLLAAGGPLRAPGFVCMWETLKNSRAGNLPPETVALHLAESPWVLRDWVDELPGIADRDAAGSGDAPVTAEGGFAAVLSEPELRWAPPEPPHFACRLKNLATAGLVASEYDLTACGRRVARISRAEDGSYDATVAEVRLPSVAPSVVAELVDREGGEAAATVIVTCFDPNESVAVFELPTGRRLKSDDRLKPTRDYAVMFASDLTLDPPGASWSAVATGRYRVETVAGRDVAALRLSSGNAVVWTPPAVVTPVRLTPEWAHIDARVEGAWGGLLPLGASYRLALRHGVDVQVVYARCRMAPVPVSTATPGTTFAGPAILPADVTPHLVVWTFGLRRDGETAQVKYVPRVRPLGAAIFRGQVWTVLGSEFQLLLDDARSAPIRVFPPESWAAQKVGLEEWAVMEGDTWVDRLGARPRPIRNLTGLGARLTIRRGPFNAVPDVPPLGKNRTVDALSLASEVVDRGQLRGVILGDGPDSNAVVRSARLELDGTLEIDERHEVIWWDRDGRLHRLRPRRWVADNVQRDDWWVVNLPPLATAPRAAAVAYGGHRLGAWWAVDWHDGLRSLGEEDPSAVAALLRWLRLPILAPGGLQATRRFAEAHATAVLPVWISDADPPEPFRWTLGGDGWRAAVREAFVEWEPTCEEARDLVDSWVGRGGDPVPGVAPALALLDFCPLLMGRFVRAWVAAAEAAGFHPSDIHAMLGQLRGEIVRNARGECLGERISGRPRSSADRRDHEALRGVLLDRCCEGFSTSKSGLKVNRRFVEELVESGVADFCASSRGRRAAEEFDQRSNIAVAVTGLQAFRNLLALSILDAVAPSPLNRRPRT